MNNFNINTTFKMDNFANSINEYNKIFSDSLNQSNKAFENGNEFDKIFNSFFPFLISI